ncbi:MAG: hypothetical protein PHS60_03430 [Zavarzinia sp.]|nr:hypothetical protein [Zavarzinia sp.]
MTATAADTANRPLPVLLPGKRSELDAGTADYMAPSKPGDPEMSFGDLLDIINPLQHIPVVSTLYRGITGDTINPVARIVGGALYGGVIGAGVAMAGAVIEQATGEEPGQMIAGVFGLGGDEAPAPTAVAAGPGGLIAEAETGRATPPAVTADATPRTESPSTPTGETAMAAPTSPPVPRPTASAGVPQLSPAAFDALIRSVGATPAKAAGAETAEATPTTAPVAPAPVATASAGTTETRRFFPAHRNGTYAPRTVPMDIRPEDKVAYDDALRLMRQNMERYTGPNYAPPAIAAE